MTQELAGGRLQVELTDGELQVQAGCNWGEWVGSQQGRWVCGCDWLSLAAHRTGIIRTLCHLCMHTFHYSSQHVVLSLIASKQQRAFDVTIASGTVIKYIKLISQCRPISQWR